MQSSGPVKACLPAVFILVCEPCTGGCRAVGLNFIGNVYLLSFKGPLLLLLACS